MITILVAEDDPDLNRAICRHLEFYDYRTVSCPDGQRALETIYEQQIDLILTDIMMPKMDGWQLARQVRESNKDIPILFLTALDDMTSKRKGYSVGIDDYLTKPIDLEELMFHIEALLRRAKIASQKKLTAGSLVLDENEMTARVDNEELTLTLREFQILFKLLSYPQKTFTRSQLLEAFSGYDSDSTLRSVDVHITNLRAKLANCQDVKIVTVRGMGYKAVIG